MKELLKIGRENKELTTRQLSKFTLIDQALISKYENGNRLPAKKQLPILAEALEINLEELTVAWYKKSLPQF